MTVFGFKAQRGAVEASTDSADRRDPREETEEIEVVVTHLLLEVGQVEVLTQDGWRYALSQHTKGVQLNALHEGQHLMCEVTRRLPRVLHARPIV